MDFGQVARISGYGEVGMKTGIMGDVVFVAVTVVAPLCLIWWLLMAWLEMLQPLLTALSVK